MLNLILAVLPDSAYAIVIALLGMLVIVGVVKPRTAFGFIGSIVVMIIAAPFVESLFSNLPLWFTMVLLLGGAFWATRTILEFTLGKHAAGHVVGTAFVATSVFICRLALAPFRFVLGLGLKAIRAQSGKAS